MELDRTGGQFKLTTFSRSLESSQCKTRLKTLRSIGQVQRLPNQHQMPNDPCCRGWLFTGQRVTSPLISVLPFRGLRVFRITNAERSPFCLRTFWASYWVPRGIQNAQQWSLFVTGI